MIVAARDGTTSVVQVLTGHKANDKLKMDSLRYIQQRPRISPEWPRWYLLAAVKSVILMIRDEFP